MHHNNGLLTSPDGAFATGAAAYSDSHPGIEDPLPRIYVQFWPEGADTDYLALLDTGGHFCILSREVADVVRPRLAHSLGLTDLLTAVGRVRGELFRHRIELIAEEGEKLAIEATVLISSDWSGPSLIGYTGGLDRMRFAVDPQTNRFFFGPLA